MFDENTGAVKEKYIMFLLQKHYAISGPGVYYQPSSDAPASAAAADKKVDVKSDLKSADLSKVDVKSDLSMPQMKRQKSAHEDLKMPQVLCCYFV